MPISVTCSECGKALRAPDALAGKKAKCPDCGAVVPIPAEAVDAEAFSSATVPRQPRPADGNAPMHDDLAVAEVDAPPEVDRKPCPMCGEMIAVSATKCRFCGEILDSHLARNGRRDRGAVVYAGFWIRFVATLVDAILVIIITGVIGAVAGKSAGNVIGILTAWLYFALQESSEKQATVGKRLVGILVTDLNGERISFGRATGRHFGKILSFLFILIGFIMAGFTEKKQALHDMLAGTLVVRK